MADKTTQDDIKFQQIYRFVVLVTVLVFTYLFVISFIPIGPDNRDNIKTILIFLLGYLSANGQYLTGGNPSAKKTDATVLQTGDSPVNNVTPPTADTTNVNVGK